MEQGGRVSPAVSGRRRYFVAVMLLLMVTLGYIDRVSISVAGPDIADELGLSAGAMGLLFSAFFWSYTLLLVPVGWLSDRYGTRVVIPLAIVVWSLGAIATGLTNRFSTMIGARLMLGAGESPVYPSGSLVAREWAPLKERGMFTGMLNAGALVGPAVGSVLAAYLVTALGWRPSFYILGGAGFLLAAVWFLTVKRSERAGWLDPEERDYILENRNATGEEDEDPVEVVPMSLASLLRQPSMWGLLLAQGCAVYTQYLFLTWLPTYMVTARDTQILGAGLLTGAIYAVSAVLSILIARFSDRYVERRSTIGGIRRRVVSHTDATLDRTHTRAFRTKLGRRDILVRMDLDDDHYRDHPEHCLDERPHRGRGIRRIGVRTPHTGRQQLRALGAHRHGIPRGVYRQLQRTVRARGRADHFGRCALLAARQSSSSTPSRGTTGARRPARRHGRPVGKRVS